MTTVIQRNLAKGEVGPPLYARADTVAYQTGVKILRNATVLRSGGTENRSGTKFVCEVKDSTTQIRLIPFRFSQDQTYMLEFGDNYMRVIKMGVPVHNLTLTITAITKANPAVLTYTGTDPANGDQMDISGVLGMTQVNGRRFVVDSVNAGANTFKIKQLDGTYLDSTSYSTYTSGGQALRVYKLATTYPVADLPQLQYFESADVITLTHQLHAIHELRRSSDSSWTFSNFTVAPGIGRVSGMSSGASGSTVKYQVTAIKDITGEEGLPSPSLTCGSAQPSPSSPITISWDDVTGASRYKVYRSDDGNEYFGLIGFAGSTSFKDVGVDPDYSKTPPEDVNPFSTSGNFPATGAYLQQRKTFANTINNPETFYTSRVGYYTNFSISTPIADGDAITATMSGTQVNRILWIRSLGKKPVLWTDTGEWTLEGGVDGGLTPTAINMQQHDYNGASDRVQPLIVNGDAIYVQARGSLIRTLVYDWQVAGYRGVDLTAFSSHLVDGFELLDWDRQLTPHPILWIVRDDGNVVSLTYVREQQIAGFGRHDFPGGFVENVCSVSEGNEDGVYFCIKRTINGRTVRYIERLTSREILTDDDVIDSCFMDCAATYDGRNTDSTKTMTISGGTTWDAGELLTLTANQSIFKSSDAGINAVFLTGSDGTVIRFSIAHYTSATVVTGFVQSLVPVAMRSAAISAWAFAKKVVDGFWHLEGEEVAVLGDGAVVASPNNPNYPDAVTVSSGTITLDKPYAVITAGLPFFADWQPLDIDQPSGETFIDKPKLVNNVTLQVEAARGVWIGPRPPDDDDVDPTQNLYEWKSRQVTEEYADPVSLKTGHIEVEIRADWKSNGSCFIRQVDPLPLSILAIAPAGLLPFQAPA